MYTVYILQCSDKSYYIGITNDLERRIGEHVEGLNSKSYTYSRRPLTLVYTADFDDVHDAISWEKKIKRWSRKKKEALIARKYEQLPELSKRQTSYKK